MKSKLLATCIFILCLMPVSITFAQDSIPTRPVEVSDQTSNEKFTEALENYRPLVGIPGIDADSVTEMGFGDYINALYRLSISIAALLAVIKIIAAGVKYMFSDIVTQKADAKKDIQGALVGLLIIIGAVIILNTVNTDITQNQILLTPTGADGTDNNISETIANSLIGMNNAQEQCDRQHDTTCLLETGGLLQLTKEWCDLRAGTFIDGNLINWGTGYNGGTLVNYCFYPPSIELSCDNNIGIDTDGDGVFDWGCEAARASCTANGTYPENILGEALGSLICKGTNVPENAEANCTLAYRVWDPVTQICADRPAPTANERVFPNMATLRSTYAPGVEPNAEQIDILNRECSFAFGDGWTFNVTTTNCINKI